MKFHCLICKENVPRGNRLLHLRKHGCNLDDMDRYKLFGWYPSDIKVPISIDGNCPNCGCKPTSQILFYDEEKNSNSFNCKFLLRCTTCEGLFFMEKKSLRKTDIKCRTCANLDKDKFPAFCKYLNAGIEDSLLEKEEYCDGYSSR